MSNHIYLCFFMGNQPRTKGCLISCGNQNFEERLSTLCTRAWWMPNQIGTFFAPMPCMKGFFKDERTKEHRAAARGELQPVSFRLKVFQFIVVCLFSCLHVLFPDMPCMKRVYRDTKRRSTGQQQGRKSDFRPAGKPRMNRLSTAGQPRVLFLHRFT